MLSRTAESLFWIGRYLERVQDLARVVDIAYHSRLEQGGRRRSGDDWEPLLVIGSERERFFARHDRAEAGPVATFMTFDLENPNSILSCLRYARENARGMRDRITSEMWETLNSFYLWLSERSLLHDVERSNLYVLYSAIKERCFLFEGVAQGTMVHDEGWQFLRVGKYLERAMMTARILDVQYPLLLAEQAGPGTVTRSSWLLRSVSAYEAYSKVFHLGIRPELAAEFLVFDRNFPRSIHYSITAATSSLKRVSESPPDRYADSAERILGWLNASLAYADRRELVDGRLHALLRDVQTRCAEVADELIDIYFAYKVPGAYEA